MTLAVIVFKSWGAAYHGLHLFGRVEGLEAMEVIPMGKQAQLLVKGEKALICQTLSQFSVADLESSKLIENWDPKVEKVFYSLESSLLQGSIAFIESDSLGLLFEIAHWALEMGFQLVDLKVPRGSVNWGLLTITAASIDDDFVEAIRRSGAMITRILDPSPPLKDFFSIQSN